MELPPDQIKLFGERVAAYITRYLSELDEGLILAEELDPETLSAALAEPLPRKAQGLDEVWDDFIERIARNSVRVGHPRFLAWTRTSPLAAAVFAEALAAALNQSVAVWDGAPAATQVELLVIDWLKALSGYTPTAGGLLTSGGSMANFVCLQAALTAADPGAREAGLSGGAPFTIYITSETHYCVMKAAEMMGLGRRYVRTVPVDEQLRMDPGALADQIRADRAAGLRPLAVAATLGTVNSGACDDLVTLGEVCRELGVWLHVDGAYGGLAALVPEKRHLAAGLEQVDSFVFDPHKTMFMPFEAGCALVRRPEYLRAAFGMRAEYLPNTAEDEGSQAFHFRDYGPQLSRSFRALKIYLTLKIYGTEALAMELSRQFDLAAQLAERLQAAPDFQLFAPAPLGIVAFRYLAPGSSPRDVSWLDAFNRRLARAVQQRGRAFISFTTLRERVALRVCFLSHRTRVEDLDALVGEIRAAASSLLRAET